MATPSGPSPPTAAVPATSKLNAALVKRSIPPFSSHGKRAAGAWTWIQQRRGAVSGGDRLGHSGGRSCGPGAMADAIDLTGPG
jgi:hypothetical protein